MSTPSNPAQVNPSNVVSTPHSSVAGTNHFKSLFDKIKDKIHNLEPWAKNFAQEATTKFDEEEAEYPEVKAAVQALLADVAMLSTLSAKAVGDKGVNPMEDYAVVQQVHQIVEDFNTHLPVFEKAFGILTADVPVLVAAPVVEPAPTSAPASVKIPTVINTSTTTTEYPNGPASDTGGFTPKTSVPSTSSSISSTDQSKEVK